MVFGTAGSVESAGNLRRGESPEAISKTITPKKFAQIHAMREKRLAPIKAESEAR